VAFPPDGSKLVSASDRTIRVWDISTGQLEQTLCHWGLVRSVAFSPNGTKLVKYAVGRG
jgi:WD40 repeat protein